MPGFNHFNQNQSQSKKKKTSKSTDNFVEALKSISSGVGRGVAKDVVKATGQTMVNTVFNRTPSTDRQPQTQAEVENIQAENEQKLAQSEHKRLHQLKQKEEIIFSAKEEKTKNEIKSLQEELKCLATDLGDVAREVQVAAIQEAVDPGQYHVTFFEHLKKLIISIKKKLSDSKSWLQTANQRADQKKGTYWGKAKKHGTKYTMSEERRKATQSG